MDHRILPDRGLDAKFAADPSLRRCKGSSADVLVHAGRGQGWLHEETTHIGFEVAEPAREHGGQEDLVVAKSDAAIGGWLAGIEALIITHRKPGFEANDPGGLGVVARLVHSGP